MKLTASEVNFTRSQTQPSVCIILINVRVDSLDSRLYVISQSDRITVCSRYENRRKREPTVAVPICIEFMVLSCFTAGRETDSSTDNFCNTFRQAKKATELFYTTTSSGADFTRRFRSINRRFDQNQRHKKLE